MASILSEKSRVTRADYLPTIGRSREGSWLQLRWPCRTVIIVVTICVAVIVLQFVYPSDRTLPNARIGAVSVSMQGKLEAGMTLSAAFKNWSRTIVTEKQEYIASSASTGLSVNVEQTLSGPLDYPWWQRLIPGSFIWRVINSGSQPVLVIDSEKLRLFTQAIHDENYQPALNATIKMDGEQASVVPDVAGLDYPAVVTSIALAASLFDSGGKLQLKPTMLAPAVTAQDAEHTVAQVQKFLAAPPAYKLGGTSGSVSSSILASWLEFTADEKAHNLLIGLNSAKLQSFLATLTPYVYSVPAGVVAAVDGQDILAIPGDDQKAIDVAAVITQLRETTKHVGDVRTVDIPQIQLSGALKANRSYSKSQLGLQALVQDLVAAKDNYAISLQQVGGQGWSASASGDKKFVTASTYKLFVAYAVLKNIEDSVWTWGGSINGQTVEACFDKMIIYSDNACAEVFGAAIGWAKIQAQMRSLGLSNTTLSGQFTSTANDLLTFMAKLGRGEILNQASRDKLLGVMKRQVYRQGIPAGVDVAVADKVGFLDGLLHDAAIVYAPQGTYALVILTSGSSWGSIAATAQLINLQLQ